MKNIFRLTPTLMVKWVRSVIQLVVCEFKFQQGQKESFCYKIEILVGFFKEIYLSWTTCVLILLLLVLRLLVMQLLVAPSSF